MQYQSPDMLVKAGQIPLWKKGRPEAIKKRGNVINNKENSSGL